MRYVQKGLALMVSLLVLVGCGKPEGEKTFQVTGTVTYQGNPVEGASVGFIPEKGRPAVGKTDAAGRFELSTFSPRDGAIAGSHKVVIGPAPSDQPEPMPGEPGYKEPEVKPQFPVRYSEAATTPLRVEVTPGKTNQFSFEMTD